MFVENCFMNEREFRIKNFFWINLLFILRGKYRKKIIKLYFIGRQKLDDMIGGD